MNASQTYYKLEEGRRFKDWTKIGLEFLLRSRRDVLTVSQISLIEKKLLEEKREVPEYLPMASLYKTHNKDTS